MIDPYHSVGRAIGSVNSPSAESSFNCIKDLRNPETVSRCKEAGYKLERWIMHVDMDAFFAAVEQYRNHPELAGKPVCVGHDPKGGRGRGVVRTASYEARAFGIHSGMPVSKAYRLCPEAVFVSGEFSSYGEASAEVMDVLRDFSDEGRVRRASIDEAYIEVTELCQDYEGPYSLAQTIQNEVRLQTKLPCSIGVAPNMSVAKIATGMNKPLGITVVGQEPEEVLKFLAPLPVDALNGVGAKTAQRLRKYDIETLGQIHEMTITDLWPMMGRGSRWLYNRAHGIDDRPLLDNGPRIRKSISKDFTFMEDIDPDEVDFLHGAITKMCGRIGDRLRQKALKFKTVTVKMRYADYATIQRSKSIPVETDDQEMLQQIAVEIFDRKRNPDKYLRLIGVKVSGLSEGSTQSSLTEFF
ncbi:MAG: DNA polymerase IV [Candidatus Thorarchaeota archaeon]